MPQPLLSVVVPYYNVEKYVGECLDSIAGQTLRDLEVICVDDGSADGSAEIVRARAAADDRITVLVQPNRGLGPARNAGVARARGRYLAFADSDDVVPPDAYATMVASLEETGSDLACGNVRRLQGDRLTQSYAHREAFRATVRRTHVREHRDLVRDRMAWNKVFRRAFWDRHGLAFPARLYEDQPVTIPAHVLARTVDVLSDVVYHWREREEGTSSITQRRLEPGNLRDRLLSVRDTAAFLAAHAPELKPLLDRESMEIDLKVAVEAMPLLAGPEREELLALARGYLDGVAAATWGDVPALTRLQLRLLQRGLIEEIAPVLAYEEGADLGTTTAAGAVADERRVRVRPRGLLRRRWYADYPLYGDPRLPADCHDVTGELKLAGEIDRVAWREERLVADGRIWVPGVVARDLRGARLALALRQGPPGGADGPRLPVAAWRVSARPRDGFAVRDDGATIAFTADLTAALDESGEQNPAVPHEGLWQLHAELQARGLRLAASLKGQVGDEIYALGPLRIGDGLWLIPSIGPGRRFRLKVRQAKAAVTACAIESGRLVISGWARGPAADAATITASGSDLMAFPARMRDDGAGGATFTAVIPLGSGDFGEGGRRLVLQRPGGSGTPLAFDAAAHIGGTTGPRRYIVTRSGQCHLILRERTDIR
ncbi:CDP-glycerol glycerophosphotransferase [Thermocatellispora tengchongensis]|uniref:CDP-glycerol glycerophosphotransferase n=1 Tax=Thermocatellispora tengchongensis TaxID=1073253 RepID=A0A840PNI5_9ACTN|nr:glycosyltransferase family 2 protein [Thermocatellispora tengchongensis]MBB5139341.1 CDP-glycerol glycerophosphotransferase [Thermocatellispora tengchongensis]